MGLRQIIRAFLVPLISVPLALVITYFIGPRIVGAESLFFAAVTLCAWYGGLVPGLVATILASALSAWFSFNPVTGNRLDIDDIVRAVIFFIVALLTSSLHITQRRSEEKLRESRDSALRANRAKDRFLATLSHELRNPLNPVLQLAALMEENPSLSRQVREDAAIIRRNIDLEAHLIDDLLDFNRIERGKLRIHPEPIDAHDLIHDVVQICAPDIDAKSINVDTELNASHHCINADPTRFRQIVWNILKNAVKFSPELGRILVQTRNDSSNADIQSSFIVEITDNGIGIDPTSLDRIFAPFEQLKESVPQRFGGLGLGLAITKSLVQSHGGQISAFSAGVNQGATFTVQFPGAKCAAIEQPSFSPSPQSNHKPMRILLIEDHADSAKILARILRRDTHQVELAGSVREALSAVQSHDFDLVISDLGLPDGSGLDLMREIRDRYHLPGVALTGYGSIEDLNLSRQAGFTHHLIKPVNLNQLEEVLSEIQTQLHPG